MISAVLVALCALLPWTAEAMRADDLARLRQETVDMFYHGYSNYMKHAFPDDELRPLTCAALTRDPKDASRIDLNDALGNYSLTLIDSLSTLAILAGGPQDGSYTGPQALSDFQDGVAGFVRYYGDGSEGPSGKGLRARGFDLDSKVQVFETVIRGLGGLLSAHLFAIGELPITGYDATPAEGFRGDDDPLVLAPISWPNGFKYDGQLLRLALDLAERLLPAFYTKTGIPYPRVNLRTGIPFYTNSPLNGGPDETDGATEGRPEITETCSAGAGSLTLEFTVLSRLSGDPRFEHAAKRAFWEVWRRRSEIGLIGNGIDAEHGLWIGPHSGIGAGMDSFFEYAFKSHVLLSGQEMPNATTSRKQSSTAWLDPNSLHEPLPYEMHSSDAFLRAWHEAHASVKRHIYTDRNHFPYYSNSHRATGQPYTMWIDSLGAFYAGLLALAGEVEEAVEANLVYTALWTRYSAIPERWSIRESSVEPGIAWWPGRPEFIESTYHLYRATRDPWYLRVGEMVLKDIRRRCYAPCGWAGLQDVRTGEKQDRMESFFLGETTKYMYLLFDPDHALNKLDAAFVFTTEGHPLIIPKSKRPIRTKQARRSPTSSSAAQVSLPNSVADSFTSTCPAPRPIAEPLTGSATAARSDLFAVSRLTNLHNTPNLHGPVEEVLVQDGDKGLVTRLRATSNHTIFPWTLPPTMLPSNGTCAAPPQRTISAIEFPASDAASSLISRFGASLVWETYEGPTVRSLEGLRLQLERELSPDTGEHVWTITHVGSTQLGRYETVFFHAEHVRHLKDEAFTCLRRKDVVDIEVLVEVDPPPISNVTSPDAETVAASSSSDNDDSLSAWDEMPPESLFRHILRAVTSSVAREDSPSSPSDQQRVVTHSWSAYTAVGRGAYPVPSVVDVPIAGAPGHDARNLLANYPWHTIYFADEGCNESLPEAVPRDHQVIVFRRGGCSFSEKIVEIPSFSPRMSSLQLVVIVDEADDDANDPDDLPRPLLDEEQVTPGGMKRVHGVPMVMFRARRGEYDLLKRAVGIGMRRKYLVKSQGLLIDNAVVL